MKKNKTEFAKTKDLMSSFFKKDLAEFIQHPEFDAALSHFLVNPDQCPPFMEQSVFYCLRNFFGDSDKTKIKGHSIVEGQTPWQRMLPFGYSGLPFPPPDKPKFTFIDLFAGIGGFRIAFQELGGKCVFSCEWDKFAKQTYQANFGDLPYGDVKQFTDPAKVSDEELNRLIPDHDILTAGFPCQPFSIAGVSKKKSLGRKHGFDDPTQGTLFFDIKRIIDVKKPAAFFLENVKHLLSHDKKRTFSIIEQTLNSLGYIWDKNIVDGANWVPQHRKRVFMVGYNPEKVKGIKIEDIIIPEKPDKNHKYKPLTEIIEDEVDEKYTLGPGTWTTLLRHKENHLKAGNGFGYGLNKWPIKKGVITRTISARYHKDGAEILIEQKDKRPRRLTPKEAMQLQGFDPDSFHFPVSDTQAYRQIGNSVVIPAVQATAAEIVSVINNRK